MDLTKIDKMLGELERGVQMALFEAFLDGKTIQWLSITGWCDVYRPCWGLKTIYRVKPAPAVTDQLRWEFIDEDYNWCARDDNGIVWVYERKPKTGGSRWIPCGGELKFSNMGIAKKLHTPGNLPWNESLIERPNNV